MTASTENPTDDARHIVWDHGRRTLCGDEVPDETRRSPNDFYLPLGKAPATDIGGEWCWSCLQLQAEARAVLAAPVVPERGQDEARDEAFRGLPAVSIGRGNLAALRRYFDRGFDAGMAFAGVARVVPARPLDDTEREAMVEAAHAHSPNGHDTASKHHTQTERNAFYAGWERRREWTSPHGLDDTEVEAWADEGKMEPASLLARALAFGDRPLSRGLKADIEVWLAAARSHDGQEGR